MDDHLDAIAIHFRDRSWAKPRPEDNLVLPPNSWTVGAFDENFTFSCNMFDQAEFNPALTGTPLHIPKEKSLNGGWLYRDGKLGRFVSGTKRIVRLPDSQIPHALDFEASDEFGRSIKVHGTAIASNVWHPWSNIVMPIMLMRWQCEGKVGYGDCQDGIWNDFLNL